MTGPYKYDTNSAKPISTDKLGTEVLRRYVAMRHQVDKDIEAIQAITRTLSLLKHYDDHEPSISPSVVGHLGVVLDKHATNIWEVLDDFISVASAEFELADNRE